MRFRISDSSLAVGQRKAWSEALGYDGSIDRSLRSTCAFRIPTSAITKSTAAVPKKKSAADSEIDHNANNTTYQKRQHRLYMKPELRSV